MFDNREIATFVWLVIAFSYAMTISGVRRSLATIVDAARHLVVAIPFFVLVFWVILLVTVGDSIGIWTPDLLKDSVIWFFGSAIALLLNSVTAWKDERFFRRTILSTFGLAAFLSFFLNFYVVHFVIEFALQPALVFLVMISAVASRNPQHRSVKILVDGVLATIGFAVFIFASFRLIGDWSAIDWSSTAREIVLPVWLTIGILPFIYLLSLYAVYESAFRRVKVASDDKAGRWRALVALIITFHIHPKELANLRGYWAKRAAEAPSVRAAREVITEFRLSTQEARNREAAKKEQLIQNAGVAGIDADGRQLDQREFEATRQALRILSGAQMGWYRNRGDQVSSQSGSHII